MQPTSSVTQCDKKSYFVYHIPVIFSRWFCYESEMNWQPITINFDVEFCRPILPHNQILCLHLFNLRFLDFQSLQPLPNWIQLHTSETWPLIMHLIRMNEKREHTLFCYSLPSAQFQLMLFYCGKGRQTLQWMSPCTPVNVPAKITWLENICVDNTMSVVFLAGTSCSLCTTTAIWSLPSPSDWLDHSQVSKKSIKKSELQPQVVKGTGSTYSLSVPKDSM